jgi:steroid-24-oyl-CoA synthetase
MLTRAGDPFEVVTEEVRGVPTKVYKHRLRNLREIALVAPYRLETPHIVYGDRRISFDDFLRGANSISRALGRDFGVAPGDRVAVLSANNPEWCLAFWGVVNSGGVLVGLNRWWKADEVLYGLENSGTKVLIADRSRFQRVADRIGQTPSLEAVLVVGPGDIKTGGRIHSFEELMGEPGLELPHTPIDEDDPAVIFYTSGTTGRPKGAISTHRSMLANLQNTLYSRIVNGLNDAFPEPEGQLASLLTTPLFHVSGCHSNMVVGLFNGIRLVIPEGRFDPVTCARLIEEERITVWAAVPTMIWKFCTEPAIRRYDLSSVASVGYGGSPSSGELQRMVVETFPGLRRITNAYGLTESSSVATTITGKELLDRPDSVGQPMPAVDIRIAGPEGEEVPRGEVGEIWIKGPTVMPGYWNDPDATAETITDGWLHTGDIGRVDEEGFLYVTDRAKDMIIRGGENIYCVEIENRLVEHAGILDAAVIGVPHPELGEEVRAVVQLVAGSQISEADVRSWVAETLADFKVPAYVELRSESLPRNASGKLVKNALRGLEDESPTDLM